MSSLLKVLLVGPAGSGKSLLANFMHGSLEKKKIKEIQPALEKSERSPTVGARILELERDTAGGVSIQLWDVSGDHQYEGVWPAMQIGAHAVIILYDCDKKEQESEAQVWYEYFVELNKYSKINPRYQCMVVRQRGLGGNEGKENKASGAMFAAPEPEGKLAGVGHQCCLDVTAGSGTDRTSYDNFELCFKKLLEQTIHHMDDGENTSTETKK